MKHIKIVLFAAFPMHTNKMSYKLECYNPYMIEFDITPRGKMQWIRSSDLEYRGLLIPYPNHWFGNGAFRLS